MPEAAPTAAGPWGRHSPAAGGLRGWPVYAGGSPPVRLKRSGAEIAVTSRGDPTAMSTEVKSIEARALTAMFLPEIEFVLFEIRTNCPSFAGSGTSQTVQCCFPIGSLRTRWGFDDLIQSKAAFAAEKRSSIWIGHVEGRPRRAPAQSS